MFFLLMEGVCNRNYRNQLQLVNAQKSILAQDYQSRSLLFYFICNPDNIRCTVQIMKLIFCILEAEYSQHFFSVAFTF